MEAKIFHPWRHGHVTSRYQQKMYTVIFKFGHALEQYPKIKFRVRQSVRWLEHIPCLYYLSFPLLQNQPQVLRTYGFLNFLLQRYLGDQATFLLINSSFASDIFLFYYILFIYLFIYLLMYLFIYVWIYLFIFHLYGKFKRW